MTAASENIREQISGVLRRKDTLVVFVDALSEHSILMSRLSASHIPFIELHDEQGRYAFGPLLLEALEGPKVIWEKRRRQILIIGDVRNVGVTHLCLGALGEGMETFFYPTGDTSDFQTEISIRRLTRSGAFPIPLVHVVEELSMV